MRGENSDESSDLERSMSTVQTTEQEAEEEIDEGSPAAGQTSQEGGWVAELQERIKILKRWRGSSSEREVREI